MSATCAVMLRTGRRARPASTHASPADERTNAGTIHPQRLTGAVDRRLDLVERRHRGQQRTTDRTCVDE